MIRLALLALGIVALIFAERSWAQEGFNIRPNPDLGIAPGGVATKNVAAFQSGLSPHETLDLKTFEFIHGLLASGRRSEKLNCRVEIRAIHEARKFSTGTKLVEILEIELFTDHFGPRAVKFSFPLGAQMGRRIVNNQDYGTVEEIKIEISEPYQNWFQFQHDGTRLVWAEIGSMYQITSTNQK